MDREALSAAVRDIYTNGHGRSLSELTVGEAVAVLWALVDKPESQAAHYFGDPCIHCGVAHDDVPPGPCPGKRALLADPAPPAAAAEREVEEQRWGADDVRRCETSYMAWLGPRDVGSNARQVAFDAGYRACFDRFAALARPAAPRAEVTEAMVEAGALAAAREAWRGFERADDPPECHAHSYRGVAREAIIAALKVAARGPS
jgi:hypothetical protein